MKKDKEEQINIGIEPGTQCVWRNALGIDTIGIFLGIQGMSGRQAMFRPLSGDKTIYIDSKQIIR